MGNMATENAAGNRIEQLLDAGSFVEIGGAVTARTTDFNNFRNLWWRLVLSTSSYRFYIYGRKECEVIRKFSECDSRKYSR